MVENFEKPPESGKSDPEAPKLIGEIQQGDVDSFNRAQKSADDGATLASFDGKGGIQLTGLGTDDSNVKLVKDVEGEPDAKDGKPEAFNFGDMIQGLKRANELTTTRGANAELNADGSLKSIEIRDKGPYTQFEFSDNGITRTTATDDKRVVTKFDRNGKPLSATEIGQDSLEGKEVPVDENDRIRIDYNTGVTTLRSTDSNGETSIQIGAKGQVFNRIARTDDSIRETYFNHEGSMTLDKLSKYHENGEFSHVREEDSTGTNDKYFDESGKLQKTVIDKEGYVQTITKGENDSTITLTERDDGSTTMELKEKDGKRYVGNINAEASWLETFKKDGSKHTSVHRDGSTLHKFEAPNGYWIEYYRNHDSGVTTMTHGDKKGAYIDGVTKFDA